MDEHSTWLIIFIKSEETLPACLIASLPIDLSKPDKYGYTALYYAARDENLGLSGFLLRRGASKKDLMKGLKHLAEIEQDRRQEEKDRAAGLIPEGWPR